MRISNINKNSYAAAAFALTLFIFSSICISAQNPSINPDSNFEKREFNSTWKNFRIAGNLSGTPAEKSIAVDAKVNLQFCVSAGKVKVTGWERDEVRVFINEGSQIGFKVLQKSGQSEKPVWIAVLGYEPSANKGNKVDECLSGDEIELEVPRTATVNIKSRESQTTIDSVRKVNIKNIGGGIYLNNIAEGVEASTYEGDVTVEKSNGAMSLESISGNVLAFDVHASEIGDIFRAKTSSGVIALQDIGHRQMEIETNSGSIKFSGAFAEGGQYGFGTTNGAVNLIIPASSSCKISASYGFGAFSSTLPLMNVIKSQSTSVKNLSATIGSGGDCSLNLRTYNGAIVISDQKDERR